MKHFSLSLTPIYCFSFQNRDHDNTNRQQILNMKDNETLSVTIIENEKGSTALTLCYFIINHLKKEPFEPFVIISNDVKIYSRKDENFDYPDDTDAINLGISLWSLDDGIMNLNMSKLLKSEYPHLFHDLNMLCMHGLFVATHKYAIHIIDICMHSVITPSIPVVVALAHDKPNYNVYALRTPLFNEYNEESKTNIELCVSTLPKNKYDDIKQNFSGEFFRPVDPVLFITGRQDRHYAGFFTLYLHVVGIIEYCTNNNYIPIINYSGPEYKFYFERENFVLPNGKITNNTWDYYFKQPLDNDELDEVLRMTNADNDVVYNKYRLMINLDSYCQAPEIDVGSKIDYYSKRTKKISEFVRQIKIHDHILDTIDSFYEMHFNNKRILGVHIRTTDKQVEILSRRTSENLRLSFTVDEYILKIKEVVEKYNIDQVFVCTETESMINKLSSEFDCLYTSCFRSSDDSISSHFQNDSRENHHYNMGLEVLMDVVLLSRCTGLLCWKSNVSDASIYMSDSKYEFLEYMS